MSTTPAPRPTADDFPGAPGPLEPTEVFDFSSRDGTGLYGEWFAAESPRALALVVHGYAEHCGRYREVANVLVRAGFSTLTYDMRGHGRAEGQRGHVDSYTDYLDDLDAALRALADRGGGRRVPVALISHSNGGLIALRALADPARAPRQVKAAVLSSPFLGFKVHVPPAKKLIGKAAGRFAPTLSLPSELDIEHLTHDPGKLAERRVDTLCHEVASAGWFVAAQQTHLYVREMAHLVKVPTLWLVAGSDLIADPEAARAVHHRLRAPSRWIELPSMYHEVFNERERARVFGHLTDYLVERFPES
jgi:alpha-beta hydrolase superfamily lysophospholipase